MSTRDSLLIQKQSTHAITSTTNKDVSQAQPDGRKFVLTVEDRSVFYGCNSCFIIPPLGAMGTLCGSFLGFYYRSYWLGGICATFFIFFFLCACYIYDCCDTNGTNAEKWLKYVMIINISDNKVYLIEESTKQRWKICETLSLNNLQIGYSGTVRSRGINEWDNAYVTLTVTKCRKIELNSKPCSTHNAKIFVQQVTNYMNSIQRQVNQKQKQKQQQQQCQNQMEININNNNNIDKSLRALIRNLKLNDQENIIKKGMKLDHWYESKPDAMIKEYKDLLVEKSRSNLSDDKIVKLLLLKCETLGNIH